MCVRTSFNWTPVFNVGFTFCVVTVGFQKRKVAALNNFPVWLSGVYCSAELDSTVMHFL